MRRVCELCETFTGHPPSNGWKFWSCSTWGPCKVTKIIREMQKGEQKNIKQDASHQRRSGGCVPCPACLADCFVDLNSGHVYRLFQMWRTDGHGGSQRHTILPCARTYRPKRESVQRCRELVPISKPPVCVLSCSAFCTANRPYFAIVSHSVGYTPSPN